VARAIAFGPAVIAVLLSLTTIAAAVHWGAFVAGGSDSNCYLTEARLFRSGSPVAPVPPDVEATWTNALLSLAPTGFTPSAVKRGALAPICPPGLGFLMGGASLAAGDRGARALVPISGALLVWSAFLLGARLSAPWIGSAAAALTLSMPILLFQLFQPMSDVPAAACLLVSLACLVNRTVARTLTSGFAAGLAILIRPNLAPAVIPLALLAWSPAGSESFPRRRLRTLTVFVAGSLPAIAAALCLNQLVYGSPFRSGYGSAAQLFTWAHVGPNVARYPAWLIEICSPWIVLGLLSPLLVRETPGRADRVPSRRALCWTIVAVSGVLLAIYLPYSVFDDWTYLRFFLPAVAMLVAAAAAATWSLLRWLHPIVGGIATAIVFSIVTAWSIQTARQHGVFAVWQSEARFVDVASWIDRHTPPGSVVITIWHSGSVRYYAGRTTLLWDVIEPAEFDLVVRKIEARHPVFLLLETWEQSRFTQRFAGATPFAALDWQPRAQFGRDIALYDLAARERFHRGEPIPADRVFTTAERAAFRR
jgi:hypothetical protein